MHKLNFRDVDLLSAQNLTEDYKKINPTQTVPALIDGDVKIFDSNAIAIYLVEKYAKDDSLYPKDLIKRTKVNEILFYVASFLFPRGFFVISRGIRGSITEIPEDILKDFMRAYETIDYILKDSKYLAGESVTLCDLSLWALTESGSQIVEIDEKRFPNFSNWLKMMRNENPFYELNKSGADLHIGIWKQCMERNRAKAAEAKSE
jgi:glutathione S-transferase